MITLLPYMPSLSCGAQLRQKLTHLVDHVVINQSGEAAKAVTDLMDYYGAKVYIATGDPSNGPYCGMGVPDVRLHLYKAASEIRIMDPNNTQMLAEFEAAIAAVKAAVASLVPAVATTQSAVDPKNGQSA
ncbi:hypothetical protein [Aeromonas phage yong1]|uniref:Uncharacterized protein n=1 Tax=Aeromonas phage yong1 TaxID=2924882 RepID=A0A9X9E363_9CAUD|nr:hypothetical protein [Aeromonas phage yong1]